MAEQAVSPQAHYHAAQATFVASLLVFFYECFAYNVILLGQVYPSAGGQVLVLPLRIVFNTLWGLAIWSYIQAHVSDPGRVPMRWQVFVENVGGAMPVTLARKEWQPRTATLCSKCNLPRPERAHHCILCNACVLRYDHHCPWINNCVGFRNHKYFLLLAIYTWLTSLMVLLSALPHFSHCAAMALSFEVPASWDQDQMSQPEAFAMLIFVLLAFCVFILLTSVLNCHGPLACRNLTTVEDFYDNMSNPFDMGGTLENISQIFGKPGPDWLLPVQPWRPMTDGVTFTSFSYDHSTKSRPDLTNVSIRTRSRVQVGDEEMVVEELWRLRYNVPQRRRRYQEVVEDCGVQNPLGMDFWFPKLLDFGDRSRTSANRRAVWI